MPRIAVEKARIRCSHDAGRAKAVSSRPFLRIAGSAVLVAPDMAGNSVSWCPNVGPTTRPCKVTRPIAKGQSRFIFANGAPVVLHRATGPTDGIPPGFTTWRVREPGQEFVHASG